MHTKSRQRRSQCAAIAAAALFRTTSIRLVAGAPEQSAFLPLERLQRAIAEVPIAFAGMPISVTASFGVAWLIAGSDTAESLLSRADAALYRAKDAGRNRVEYAATGLRSGRGPPLTPSGCGSSLIAQHPLRARIYPSPRMRPSGIARSG
jgi:hypothetical protein